MPNVFPQWFNNKKNKVKVQCHEPLRKSTLFKILEVLQAQCCSWWHGRISDYCDIGWNSSQRSNGDTAVHKISQDYPPRADHCQKFALIDPEEPDFQQPCSHQHVSTCDGCQGLKNVLQEVWLEIEGPSRHLTVQNNKKDLLKCCGKRPLSGR